MKRSFALLTTILLILVVASCTKNNPKTVATTFLNDFFHNDYEGAKKVSTKETQNMIGLMEELNSKLSDSAKAELMKMKVNIKSVKENGDKATVIYTTSDNPKDQYLHLVKENGQWLAQLTKQDLMDNNDDQNTSDQSASSDSTSAAKPATDTTQKK